VSWNPRVRGVVVAAFGLLTVFFTGQFPPFANPNELSRLETVYSFVEHGTFAIDRALPVLGDHEDKSASGGRFYSNKAPGLALAAIPVYRVLRIFFPRPHSAADTIFVLLRILVVSSLCIFALARFLARLAAARSASLVGFALAFGTPFLFYARSFFGHAWTASLLLLSWDLLRAAEEREHNRRVGALLFAAGFVAMWAAISEYTVAPVGALLAARAFSGRSARRLGLFAAGALLPLTALMAYDASCFGSPFVLSSAREASPLYSPLSRQGFFGFGPPSATVAIRYLVDPARGILLYSPFWLWAAAGFWKWWRARIARADAAFCAASVLLSFLLLTGYANWHGGWSLGSRYLLPLLFLGGLALPHALTSPLSRLLFLCATVFSTTVFFLLTASWPHFPPDLRWEVGSGAAWFLAHGWVAPNLFSRFGVFSLIGPAAVTLAAGVAAARVAFPGGRGAALAALTGLLLAAGMLFLAPEPSYMARLWRAAVFGAYSGLDPDRRELKGVALSARTPIERRQALAAWRLYGPRH